MTLKQQQHSINKKMKKKREKTKEVKNIERGEAFPTDTVGSSRNCGETSRHSNDGTTVFLNSGKLTTAANVEHCSKMYIHCLYYCRFITCLRFER